MKSPSISSFSSLMGSDDFGRALNIAFVMLSSTFGLKLIAKYPFVLSADIIVFCYVIYVENRLSAVMLQMANFSSSYFQTPKFLIPLGLIAVTAFVLLLIPLILRLQIVPPQDFIGTYLATMYISLLIFLLSTGMKSLLLGTKFINFKYTRRGFFAVFQRIFLFIREIIVSFSWIYYFSGVWPIPSLFSIICDPQTPTCVFYIVSKSVFLIIILFDLYFTIKDYTINSAVAFKPVNPEDVDDECVICQGMPEEPVMLSCGHIFCYGCAYRWLSKNPTCPICRAPIAEKRRIEYSDGAMPLAAYFCTF